MFEFREGQPERRLSSADERDDLVRRVLANAQFLKSTRLCEFLIYIWEKTRDGRLEEIHEHQIGCRVYGRRPDYNASEDNIVRVEARRLRKALEAYFEEDGKGEPVTIRIPKGSYVPVFEPRKFHAPLPPPTDQHTSAAAVEDQVVAQASKPSNFPALRPERRSRPPLVLLASVFAVLLLGGWWLWGEKLRPRRESASSLYPSPNIAGLWPHLFDANNQTHVVVADSCLSLLQHLTRHRVSLRQYVSRSYLSNLNGQDQRLIAKLQYTSLADTNIVARILRLDSRYAGRTSVRYARNIETRDFNQDHHILLGSRWANPWGELFAEGKNFEFEYDWERRQPYYRNKSARPGEQERYFERGPAGNSDEQYGVITFLPNLRRNGNVLIIEGTSMEGTEAAWELLSNTALSAKLLSRLGWGNNRAGRPTLKFCSRRVQSAARQRSRPMSRTASCLTRRRIDQA